MSYSESEARKLIIKAGLELLKSKLIVTTNENISARISETEFIITPSELSYETLRPEQLVVVNINNCSYKGSVKPSNEKEIHADVYRLRSKVNFIIHTHQINAAAVTLDGTSVSGYPSEYESILGGYVPCSQYGIPSTSKLRKNVAAVVASHPSSSAVLMKYHGALCMGLNFENSCAIAKTLEHVCELKIKKACGKDIKNYFLKKIGKQESMLLPFYDFGKSVRNRNTFTLIDKKGTVNYNLDIPLKALPFAAAVHSSIYHHSNVKYIIHSRDPFTTVVSAAEMEMKPRLDDLARVAGISVKTVCIDTRRTEDIVKALKGRNAVFIENSGALCTGKDKNEAEEVCMILKKSCKTEVYASALTSSNKCRLCFADTLLQRIMYKTTYLK